MFVAYPPTVTVNTPPIGLHVDGSVFSDPCSGFTKYERKKIKKVGAGDTISLNSIRKFKLFVVLFLFVKELCGK